MVGEAQGRADIQGEEAGQRRQYEGDAESFSVSKRHRDPARKKIMTAGGDAAQAPFPPGGFDGVAQRFDRGPEERIAAHNPVARLFHNLPIHRKLLLLASAIPSPRSCR
jgi:hypothetical protein